MTSKPIPVYWDSCVFIDCIQQEPTRYPELRGVLDEATSGRIILVASTMVIAEVVKLKQSQLPIGDQIKLINEFFENDYIEVRGVDRDTAERAAQLCRDYGLKPPDAIHVATAIRAKCNCLHTYDGENKPQGSTRKYLLDLDGKIGWPALKIQRPKRLFPDSQKSLLSLTATRQTEHSPSVWGLFNRNRKDHPLRMRSALSPLYARPIPGSVPVCRLP